MTEFNPEATSFLRFGPFHLDRTRATLWRGHECLALRPRALAVLQYLAERPGQIISTQTLLDQIWVGTHVTRTSDSLKKIDIRFAADKSHLKVAYL